MFHNKAPCFSNKENYEINEIYIRKIAEYKRTKLLGRECNPETIFFCSKCLFLFYFRILKSFCSKRAMSIQFFFSFLLQYS